MEFLIKDKLRSERNRLQISREKLAQLSNVTSMTLYRAETTGSINLLSYIKIFKALKDYEANSGYSNSPSNI
jgi:DNA-binding XRE family transcriptional regulator